MNGRVGERTSGLDETTPCVGTVCTFDTAAVLNVSKLGNLGSRTRDLFPRPSECLGKLKEGVPGCVRIRYFAKI